MCKRAFAVVFGVSCKNFICATIEIRVLAGQFSTNAYSRMKGGRAEGREGNRIRWPVVSRTRVSFGVCVCVRARARVCVRGEGGGGWVDGWVCVNTHLSLSLSLSHSLLLALILKRRSASRRNAVEGCLMRAHTPANLFTIRHRALGPRPGQAEGSRGQRQ
jgi:hypothetical protein